MPTQQASGKPPLFFAGSRSHLRSAGESYFAHLRVAGGIGATMIFAGAACLVHGLLPGIFTDRGSKAIRRLSARIANRHNQPLAEALDALEYEI